MISAGKAVPIVNGFQILIIFSTLLYWLYLMLPKFEPLKYSELMIERGTSLAATTVNAADYFDSSSSLNLLSSPLFSTASSITSSKVPAL